MTNEPNAAKELTPALFDPINGDGITRKCTVSCDPPAKAVYAAMDTGTSKGYASNSISTQEPIEPEPDPVAEAEEKIRMQQ